MAGRFAWASPGGCPDGDGRRALAVEYDRHNASGAANSYYERPATIGLLGEVRGRRVLEVGCGTGPVTQWLVDHGADVVACDVSAAMLEIASSRVGASAELHQHDLAEPLTFLEDASVDLVVASLVFHYLRNWVAPLLELHRARSARAGLAETAPGQAGVGACRQPWHPLPPVG